MLCDRRRYVWKENLARTNRCQSCFSSFFFKIRRQNSWGVNRVIGNACVISSWVRVFVVRNREGKKRERKRETVGSWLEESCWVVLCSICLFPPICIFFSRGLTNRPMRNEREWRVRLPRVFLFLHDFRSTPCCPLLEVSCLIRWHHLPCQWSLLVVWSQSISRKS